MLIGITSFGVPFKRFKGSLLGGSSFEWDLCGLPAGDKGAEFSGGPFYKKKIAWLSNLEAIT